MNVNEQARFQQLAERNQHLASRADSPDIRKVHEAWVTFYKKLAANAIS
ncbi:MULTISPECIES: hypothetical protein [unclassified Sphingobium]|jgi:hypothetical protein|nr:MULTISPECIES: hypothetical protein [unclassified Sphingobium]CAD7335382.1 hypothetical protein SPHS6_00470 [Sphingobium sp. S6]CAD7335447.1 hypothetical protein SPHS8_00512 [Sphingobium sp. S8]